MSEKDFEFDTLTLLDENGVEHEFELVDSIEVEEKEYIALIPIFDDAENMLDDSGELVIMQISYEGDEQFLDTIDDDDEYVEISDMFMERLSDFFEFEEE